MNKGHYLQENIRHIFTNYITWNCIFASFNFAAIGWIVYSFDKIREKPAFIIVISSVLIIQCALGLVASKTIINHMKIYEKQIEETIKEGEKYFATSHVYIKCVNLMGWGLSTIIAVWLFLPFCLLN